MGRLGLIALLCPIVRASLGLIILGRKLNRSSVLKGKLIIIYLTFPFSTL